MHLFQALVLCLSVVFLNQCGSPIMTAKPPSTFSEEMLVGQWENYHMIQGTETLNIAADHTFHQVYRLDTHTAPVSVQGIWYVEHKSNGCLSLHLERMHNIHIMTELIDLGNRYEDGRAYEFRDLCDLTTMTMLDKVVLSIVDEPRDSTGFMLLFPCFNADCLEQSFHHMTP